MLKKQILYIAKSKLLGSFSIYVISSLVNAAIPFLLLPVFTKYLSKTDYGIVSMFTILSGFFMPFVGLSCTSVLSREYFNQGKTQFNSYVGNVFYVLFFSMIPISIFIYLFSNKIAALTEIPVNFIWLVLIFSFFSFFFNISLTIWQFQSKAKQYGLFQISHTLINVTLTLIMVVFFNWGWEGRVLSQVFAVFILGCIGFYILYKDNQVKFKFDKRYFKDALMFGIPLIPHTLGAIIISMSDRFFITNMVSIEVTGLYAVGYSIANIIGFLEHSFNLAYTPWLFEKLNLKDLNVKLRIVKFTYLYFIYILMAALLLALISPIIFDLLIDQKFEGAQQFVFWIALSFAFSGMYKMVANYIFYVKKTYILAWLTFGSALVNIVLNYFLIREFGAVGAAISTTIVSLLFFIFTWFLSNKVYQMPWRSRKLLFQKKYFNK